MNTVTNSDNTSVNESAQSNPANDEAARAAQMEAPREEAPRARERPIRREPSQDEPRESLASSDKRKGTVIPLGSDNSSAKPTTDREQLAPLFAQNLASDYRSRWDVVQQGFVDDPRRAVQQGDELVTEVMRNLTETFSKERSALEGKLGENDETSTEMLRVALRRYRSFFERLLSF